MCGRCLGWIALLIIRSDGGVFVGAIGEMCGRGGGHTGRYVVSMEDEGDMHRRRKRKGRVCLRQKKSVVSIDKERDF